MKYIRADAQTEKTSAKEELAKYALWRRPALKRLFVFLARLCVVAGVWLLVWVCV
jgi:hypothetical protein